MGTEQIIWIRFGYCARPCAVFNFQIFDMLTQPAIELFIGVRLAQ